MRLLYALLTLFFAPFAADAQSYPIRADKFPAQSLIELFRLPPGATGSETARALNPTSLGLIMDFEGWSSTAYNDAVQYCTIGYGHLIALKRCEDINLGIFAGTISETDGRNLLEDDTRLARSAVQRVVSVPISDDQFGALSSFVFNVGSENFKKSTLLRLLNSNQPDQAARQLPFWVKAGSSVLPGLVARRACEEALFRSKVQLDANGKFIRARCAYPPAGAVPNEAKYIDIYRGEAP